MRMTAILVVAITGGLSLAMMGAWWLQKRQRNAGWVDPVWTFALGAAGVVYALMQAPAIDGSLPRRIFVAGLAAIWSCRLGLHLVARARRGAEDSRYAQFRQEWGAAYERRMFGFLQIQAAAAAFLALTMLAAARNRAPVGVGDWLALALACVALGGEAIADAQLQAFRDDSANRGKICETGLWRWSRHPNYFFEWLGWFAYPLFAIRLDGSHPWGWFALSGPAFMYVLLVHVSGIPPLERQMLHSRGDAFRVYRARVSAFFPWPPARFP